MRSLPLPALFAWMLFHCASYSQQQTSFDPSRLFLPGSDAYQSVATVDNANGIFLNPAAGGLENGFNLSYSGIIRDSYYAESQVGMVGIPFFNTLGFRSARDKAGESSMTSWLVGTASGTADFSIGTSVQFLSSDIGGKSDAASSWSAGFIARASRGLSLGYAWRNIGSVRIGDLLLPGRHDFGIGVRPLGNRMLTLFADGEMTSKQNLKNIDWRLGANIGVLPGVNLYGAWSSNQLTGKSVTAGIAISLVTAGVWGGGTPAMETAEQGGHFGILLNEFERSSFVRKRHRVAEMEISGVYNDYSTPGFQFFGATLAPSERGVQSLVTEIDRIGAAEEYDVLVLNIKSFQSTYNFFGMSAAMQEVGAALDRLRQKGKKIVAFLSPGDGLGSGASEMYLASYANTIFMSEYSALFRYGIAYDAIKLRGAIRKLLKIDVRTYTAGKYKSSLNQLADSLPPHKVEELNALVDNLYEEMLSRLSAGRSIRAKELADTLSGVLFPEQARALGIIDSIGWYEDAKRCAHRMATGDTLTTEAKTPVAHEYGRERWREEWGKGDRIAVIGVYGGITTGESSSGGLPIPLFGGERTTGSETLRKQVEKAASDGSVKGIVLRVDSPGGSAVGSDEIYRALEKVKKPVVVSMGDVAASGGYYVSSFSKKIFASPATITASIGVIGQIPYFYDLFDAYDVYVRSFSRGKYSDALDVFRPPTPESEAQMHAVLEHTYEKFLQRIHAGRGTSMDSLRVIAQGRIYTGRMAKSLGLIDEFGGLHEALEWLKKDAKLDEDIAVEYYPVRAGGLAELVQESLLVGPIRAWIRDQLSAPHVELR